jgi:NAD(P)-dependent dehydrogenase (short-subunit alcohol dehydrogenase family)
MRLRRGGAFAMKEGWSARDIPRLVDSIAVVTGANSGIGYVTALELGRAGATVILGCRDPARGATALERLKAGAPSASFVLEALDLSSLASVRTFAEHVRARYPRLDLLVNNAGIMAIPDRRLTPDGFEIQFGTNHLGHFALTGLLFDRLLAAPAPRVVTVSSGVAAWAKLDLDNLQSERRYTPMGAYGQSKLANLLFMRELDRRARPGPLVSVAAHPGATVTNLQQFAFARTVRLVGQPPESGALPSLYGATAPGVSGGSYFGPRGWFGLAGPPTLVSLPRQARSVELARRLWASSETLTGVPFAVHRPEEPASSAAGNA